MQGQEPTRPIQKVTTHLLVAVSLYFSISITVTKENKKPLGFRPEAVTADGARAIRQKAEAAKPQEVSIISKAELDRIKSITKVQTKQEVDMQRTVIEEQKATSLMASKARRQRIVENDFKRATDKQNVKPQDVPKKEKVENMLTKALDKLDEEDDDVKGFNQLCLQAKVLELEMLWMPTCWGIKNIASGNLVRLG